MNGAFFDSTDVSRIYLGDVQIKALRLGESLVWPGPTYTFGLAAGFYGLEGFEMLPPFNAQNGDYTLIGAGVRFIRHRVLLLDSGDYAQTGEEADAYKYKDLRTTGLYQLVGRSASFHLNRRVALEAGAYALTGNENQITPSIPLNTTGSYALTGVSVTFTVGLPKAKLDAGLFVYRGEDVAFHFERYLEVESGAYALTGNGVETEYQRSVALESGAYTLTGEDAAVAPSETLVDVDLTFAFDYAIVAANDVDLTLALDYEIEGA